MKQTTVWTVLPRGLLPGGALSLSVLVSPRLTPDTAEAPLSAFPAFMGASGNWASQDFSFAVELGSGPVPVTPVRTGPPHALVKPAPGALDPALFTRLFGATVVRAHAFPDLRARKIRSFPVAHVLAALQTRYAGTALLSPADRPPAPTPRDPLAALDFTRPKTREGLAGRLAQQLAQHGHVPPSDPDLALDFFQALDFHAFKGCEHEVDLTPPSVDFHEAIALLADIPALLRKLGLLFDLVVPAPDHAFTRVRVRPAPAAGYTAITPWTAVDDKAGAAFAAASAGDDRRGGFLDLTRPEVTVTQVDVDGAAFKLVRFIESAMIGASRRSLGAPERAGLPALRSAGLSISLTDRAGRLQRTLARAGALQDAVVAGRGDGQLLHAEDLTRGLRFDVRGAVGGWRSLHRRVPTVTLLAGAAPVTLDLGVHEEEGTFTTAVTSPTDPTKGDDLFIHETLVHWNGWSLSAPRPGNRIDLVGDGVAPSKNPAVNALGLAVSHEVAKGSLPRLRFGARYRLRARAVDLAGNSLPYTSDDDGAATAEAPYLRFEPVPAPLLSREADVRPGESMDRLVIRSHNASPALDGAPTAETCARGVFPPKASISLAEQHGAFDLPDGTMDKESYKLLAHIDDAQVPERTPAPTPGAPLPLASIRYVRDPLARGVRLRGLPSVDVLDIPCAGPAWSDVQAFRIDLREGDAAPAWDPATRCLRVCLPKGQVTTLRLASRLPGPDALDALGVWQWFAAACPPALLATYRARAAASELWLLTPDREVTLVHAVQQPLARPAVAALAVVKAAGKTHAELRGALDVHAASTGEVEVVARWSDRVDSFGSPTGDAWEARAGQVGALLVDDPAVDRIPLALRHELGDTRYRRVAYALVATSRFRECFLDAAAPLDLTRPGEAAVERDILSSARPAAPLIEYVLPTFGWTTDAARDGLASRRSGRGLRVYLGRPWFSSGDGELLGVVVAHGPRVTYADRVSEVEATWLSGQVVAEVPERLRSLVTLWGADPTWVSAPAWPNPSLHHFPRKTAQAYGLTLDELDGQPAEGPWSLAVAGHPVDFDAERGLWYCDLELDAGTSYFPFVRLALCRFQPRSVAGVEVSRVVLADFVQLAPDRLAWVGSVPGRPRRVQLSVSGEAPRGRASAELATVVTARVEVQLDPTTGHWLPAPSVPVILVQTQITATVAVWSGELELPHPRGEVRQRLVVEEHEMLPRDPTPATAAMPLVAVTLPPGLRCVYADVIEL